MTSIRNTLSAMVVAALAAGCASAPSGTAATTPATVPAGAPASQPAVISSATPAAQPVSLATPAPSGADAKQKALEKTARTMGYKPRKEKDGTTRWCKTEATLGSRFQTTSCVSEETLAMEVQEMLQTQDYMRSQQGCNGAGCSTH